MSTLADERVVIPAIEQTARKTLEANYLTVKKVHLRDPGLGPAMAYESARPRQFSNALARRYRSGGEGAREQQGVGA